VGADPSGIAGAVLANADPKRIKQVVRNLLANALRFTRRGTNLELSLESSSDGMRFRVRDFGPGIPDAELETIFDKFVQSSRTRDAGGTGLGLAICRKIVKAHGGRIWAENHPEEGAIFTFELPSAGVVAPSVATS
jgi:signal transduction histidine kinase